MLRFHVRGLSSYVKLSIDRPTDRQVLLVKLCQAVNRQIDRPTDRQTDTSTDNNRQSDTCTDRLPTEPPHTQLACVAVQLIGVRGFGNMHHIRRGRRRGNTMNGRLPAWRRFADQHFVRISLTCHRRSAFKLTFRLPEAVDDEGVAP